MYYLLRLQTVLVQYYFIESNCDRDPYGTLPKTHPDVCSVTAPPSYRASPSIIPRSHFEAPTPIPCPIDRDLPYLKSYPLLRHASTPDRFSTEERLFQNMWTMSATSRACTIIFTSGVESRGNSISAGTSNTVS